MIRLTKNDWPWPVPLRHRFRFSLLKDSSWLCGERECLCGLLDCDRSEGPRRSWLCRLKEYDATRLSRTDALDAGCRLARSFLEAFDVARHGAVALERIKRGRWQTGIPWEDPRNVGACLFVATAVLGTLAMLHQLFGQNYGFQTREVFLVQQSGI